eukprot:3584057-Pyramimonas_sp.AAC.1
MAPVLKHHIPIPSNGDPQFQYSSPLLGASALAMSLDDGRKTNLATAIMLDWDSKHRPICYHEQEPINESKADRTAWSHSVCRNAGYCLCNSPRRGLRH